jgi:hypothetical protein
LIQPLEVSGRWTAVVGFSVEAGTSPYAIKAWIFSVPEEIDISGVDKFYMKKDGLAFEIVSFSGRKEVKA